MKLPARRSQPRRRLALAFVAALLALGAFASTAQACSYPGGAPVFSRWGDQTYYVFGQEGGFESGAAGWSLHGGAQVVRGNESYYLHSGADGHSLSLPAGSSATSPPICMELDTPSFRLLARNTGEASSTLRVEAVYTLLGALQTKVLDNVTAGSSWQPTQQMSTVLSLSTVVGTLIPSSIQIRIAPLDNRGQWQVDDLYVDPFARH